MLTPPAPVPQLQLKTIVGGPAAGCQMLLPVPSPLADCIVAGDYEPESVRLLQRLISPSDTCYDIGGHYGVYSVILARLANQGHVFTFEPVPSLADAIRRTLAASQLNNVTLRQAAMAGNVGQMTLRYAATASGDDSMAFLEQYGGVNTPRSQVQYAHFQEIRTACVTLDSLTTPVPSFIKIDAEGAEAAIIKSGLKMLASARPRLLIEVHGVDLALECAQLLGSLGYVALQIAQRSLAMPVLWIHHTDTTALSRLRAVPGESLPILYGVLDEAERGG